MPTTWKPIPSPEKKELLRALARYPLYKKNGSITLERNTVGFVNKIYRVTTGGAKYILRESRPETDTSHIRLEVEVLAFLEKKRFSLTPAILKNNNNESITTIRGRRYIVQTFMPGETKAGWDNLQNFNVRKLKSFFSAAALFARTVRKFKPSIRTRNVTVADYVETAKDDFDSQLQMFPASRGKTLLEKSANAIKKFMTQTQKDFGAVRYRDLPPQLVHFDFHPGNVNFIGNTVSGIFDFDWIRFESRITDIAAAIAQSCYFYGGARGGLYRRERIKMGLAAYRKTYGKSEFAPREENKLIAIALKGYIIFQLIFTAREYAAHYRSPRHLVGLDHFIKLVTSNNYDLLLK